MIPKRPVSRCFSSASSCVLELTHIPGRAVTLLLSIKAATASDGKLHAKFTSRILRNDPSAVVGIHCWRSADWGRSPLVALATLWSVIRRSISAWAGRTMNGIVHPFEVTSSGNTGLTGLGPSPTSATTVPRLIKLSPDSALAVSAKNGASHGPKQPMETYPAVKDWSWCVIPNPLTTVPATASPSPWTCSDHQGRDNIAESLWE